MADIGRHNFLTVTSKTDKGLVYLDGGLHGPILIPSIYLEGGTAEIGERLKVFVYRDTDDRLVATTETPLAMVGEFGCFEVVALNQRVGAFLDWGLGKDLLLPFGQQRSEPEIGERVVARVLLDDRSDRIVASTRLGRYLDKDPAPYHPGQKVRLLIAERTPLGFNAIIEDAHRGLLYASELPRELQIGEQLDGYVRALREDGGIDLSLTQTGRGRIKPLGEQILAALEQGDGFMELDDRSPPEEIRRVFGASKKAFKQALGGLYRERKIILEKPGVRLVE